MKKVFLVAIVLLIAGNCFSQSQQEVQAKPYFDKINIGLGLGWDFNNTYILSKGYTLDDPATYSSMAINLYARLHRNKFNFYPTISFQLTGGDALLNNLNGTFEPEGNTVHLPYSTVGNGWTDSYTSNEYLYFLSRQTQSNISVGCLVSYEIGSGFEVGTGLNINFIHRKIFDGVATDNYSWVGSTGTTSDDYEYVSTDNLENDAPTINETLIKPTVPLSLIYRYDTEFIGLMGFLTVNIGTPSPIVSLGATMDFCVSNHTQK